MKTISKLFLFSTTVLATVGCGSQEPTGGKMNEPVDVVVISGQSNAVGCTNQTFIKNTLGTDKYYEYMRGYPGIPIAFDSWTKDSWTEPGKVYYYSQNTSKNNDFVKVMLGQGNSQATFGPEIGIAEKLNETRANKLFLIKYACGASNLKDDWADRNSEMYPRLISYVKYQMNNLKNKGYTPTIKAFCWMQGECDSYPNYYDKYLENTRKFVSNLREDLKDLAGGENTLPFIDAGINNSKEWEYWKEVNEAKAQFATESEKNIYIDTIGAGLHTDREENGDGSAHYDSDSEVKLGNLFAEAFEPFLTKLD